PHGECGACPTAWRPGGPRPEGRHPSHGYPDELTIGSLMGWLGSAAHCHVGNEEDPANTQEEDADQRQRVEDGWRRLTCQAKPIDPGKGQQRAERDRKRADPTDRTKAKGDRSEDRGGKPER